jgi:hypothetical protein
MLKEEERKLANDPENKHQQEYVNYWRQIVRGHKYRGKEGKKPGETYKVSSRTHWHYYIGHYDHEKYKQQMVNYREGKRKSRPNGRKWCYLPTTSYHREYRDGKPYIVLHRIEKK